MPLHCLVGQCRSTPLQGIVSELRKVMKIRRSRSDNVYQYFHKYPRKKTPLEVLESLEDDIQWLENDRQSAMQTQKKVLGHLMIYSVLLYVILAAVFYFYYFPASLKDRIFYMMPLLIFPILVFIIKRLLSLYFRRNLVKSKEKLIDLRAKKKKILDEVMDKETFKVAKEILEKFAPDQLNKNIGGVSPKSPPRLPQGPVGPGGSPEGDGKLVGPGPRPLDTPRPLPRPTPMRPGGPPTRNNLVRPILNQNRGYMDRIIEALVGDGPNNRYALICANCASHNGMALKEEFEFLAFRCAYCGYPNPSRKVRPRQPSPSPSRLTTSRLSINSEIDSHSESEEALIKGSQPEDTEELSTTDKPSDETLTQNPDEEPDSNPSNESQPVARPDSPKSELQVS